TASLRTAPQPGFWEDPKQSGLLSTQQPERPKSELWHKKYEKCDLSKACDAACVCAGERRHPCDGRKRRKNTSTCGGLEFPTIRSAAVLECVACIDSPQGLGGAWSIGQFRLIKARSRCNSAEIPRPVWCYDRLQPQCQQGGNHEHDNVGFTRCVGRRAEAGHPTARFVLFAYP